MTQATTRRCTEKGCDLETDDGVEYLADQLRHQGERQDQRQRAVDGKLDTLATGLLELTQKRREGERHDRHGVMECPGCHGAVACPACYQDEDAAGPDSNGQEMGEEAADRTSESVAEEREVVDDSGEDEGRDPFETLYEQLGADGAGG